MRLIFSTFILAILYLPVKAQDLMNRDSLLKLLPAAKDDSNKVLLYINIGQQYESNEPEVAKQYYRAARDLSEKIGYTRGLIKFAANYTYVLNMQGLYDSSLTINKESVELSRKIKDSLYLAKTLFNTGSSYRVMGDFENAVKCYEEGKVIFANYKDDRIQAQGDDILQNLYTELHQYDKGIEYGERSVKILRKLDIPPLLGISLMNLGINYQKKLLSDKAEKCYREALEIAKSVGDKNMEATGYLNITDIYFQSARYEEMKPYVDKAIALSRELDLHESELIAIKALAFHYMSRNDYVTGEKKAQEALAIANAYNLRIQREKVYNVLASIAYARHNLKLGEEYETKAAVLSDSLLNEEMQKNNQDLEKKYETEQKVGKIKELEAERQLQALSIKQKNILNYILIGSAIILLIIFMLSYRNYKQKQKLQQRRIAELETEKKLAATEAVLKGEEQERTRLAKDLHDGLGGMLSGIKYSFQTMKENLVMTPENMQSFERSMDMLDSSIREMRRVAHNMMPESLVKFGLDAALKDFCNDINHSGALKVSYQSFGLADQQIDQTVAITIYRIVQELINNTIKHAAATEAIVQVTKTDGTISITTEDDGKGFDTAILQRAKGIGWSNIQNRIEFLKGKLDVRSEEGKGTSVHIEINND